MKDWTIWLAAIASIAGSGIMIVALAAAGESQSAWLVCEVAGFGVCR